MSTTERETGADPIPGAAQMGRLPPLELLKKLAIWALFIALIYVTRDFFFTGFMTFLFSYLALGLIDLCMKTFAGKRFYDSSYVENAALRRLVTAGVFVLVPIVLVVLGMIIMPRLIEQAQYVASWLSQVSPEAEVARLAEGFVGPSEFKRHYAGPDDPRYQKDFEEFKSAQILHVKEYHDFPNLESWVEGAFHKEFVAAEEGRVRARLLRAGTSSKEFKEWFLKKKAPDFQAGKPPLEKPNGADVGPMATAPDPLAAARRDPATLNRLRDEWIKDEIELAKSPSSPAYQEAFRAYYQKRAQESPLSVPYTVDEYLALQKARSHGAREFGDALEKLRPGAGGEESVRADFEAAKKHEFFHDWWATNAAASFIRRQIESVSSGAAAIQMDHVLAALLSLPVDLATALLLSFFICIDFQNLKIAVARLRETWLCDVYDEIAPALSSLGQLIGRAMYAQGLIALCNAAMMFVAMTILGVEHSVLLSFAVFMLCLVPTLGMIIAWVLIVAMALLQPAGGIGLALKASGAVLFVVLMETFVFSPRILGRVMELHPILIISILPVAQHFFGVWGLILATPVAVYVIHVLILRRALPGGQAVSHNVRCW